MKKTEVSMKKGNKTKAILLILGVIGVFVLSAQITVNATTNNSKVEMTKVKTETLKTQEDASVQENKQEVEGAKQDTKDTENTKELMQEIPFGMSEEDLTNLKNNTNETSTDNEIAEQEMPYSES